MMCAIPSLEPLGGTSAGHPINISGGSGDSRYRGGTNVPDWCPGVEMATCGPCGRTFASVDEMSAHMKRNPLCAKLHFAPLTGGAAPSTGPAPEGVELTEFADFADASGAAQVMYDVSGLVADLTKYPDPVFCQSCGKCFSVERSLARHLERFPACANRILNGAGLAAQAAPAVTLPPLNEWVDELLLSATARVLDSGVECKWCQREYATRSALHKHLKSATACNASATEAFKQKVAGALPAAGAPVR